MGEQKHFGWLNTVEVQRVECYTINVSLRGIRPPAWRRLRIRKDGSFAELHEAIQAFCGWSNSHLFRFMDLGGHLLAGLPEDQDDVTTTDARINRIARVFGSHPGTSIGYLYDLGAGWLHDITLVSVEDDTSGDSGPQLIASQGKFPPEDSVLGDNP